MVIVELSGGMGNQMFEYAAGRSLAMQRQVPLKLYSHKLKFNWSRNYALKALRIDERFIRPGEVKRELKSCTIYRELPGGVDKNNFNAAGSVYLDGYWQSYRYFENIEPVIREEFTFHAPPSGKNKIIAEQIEKSESVAVHVRRGDFVTISKTLSRYGGICDMNYYQRCFSYIKSKTSDPVFYIFSDDPKWVKENLPVDGKVVYVTHNSNKKHSKWENNYYYRNSLLLFKNLIPEKGFEDLRLMSLCKHFIIANSSFSWWGAWLGKNKSKIVCAPSRWINASPDQEENAIAEYNDLIPDSWINL